MERRAFIIAGAAATASLGASANAQTASTLRVIAVPNDASKALYYAQTTGIFRKYGVNVDINLVNSGSAASAALVGGSGDIAGTNLTSLLLAHAKGVPMQILVPGPLFDSADPKASVAIIVPKEGPIRTARDLNGKTVGSVALGDLAEASTRAWIDKNGGDARTVKFVEVPGAAAAPALTSNRVSASTLVEPFVSQALANAPLSILANPLTAVANRFLVALFAVMSTPAEQHADELRRYVRAAHEAAQYTNTHLAETVDLVAGYSKTSPDVVARSARFIDAEYADASLIQPVIDVLVKYDLIQHGFSASDVISPYALQRGR